MTTMMFGEDGTASGRGALLQPNHVAAAAHTEIKMIAVRRIIAIISGLIRISMASGYCR
jgi:hypothetical protein